MASSRTGTAKWMRVRDQARTQAIDQGVTNCPRCRVRLDWQYSGRPNSAEVDHILPHAQGGQDTIANTRILCRRCNQQLGGMIGKRRPRPTIQTTDLPTAIDW